MLLPVIPDSLQSSARARLFMELSLEISDLEGEKLRRLLTTIESVDGPIVRIGGRHFVGWCSNDYLGLSSHPLIINAAAEAARNWGIGAGASRLLSGTTMLHSSLEETLASYFGAESAIVYSSGYLANLGTLGSLLSSEDAVVVDRLSHASLIDAARSTHAKFSVFRHNDTSHVAEILRRMSSYRRRMIVTEGVFSMEGDFAPLAEDRK